jgi:hypothetical protein
LVEEKKGRLYGVGDSECEVESEVKGRFAVVEGEGKDVAGGVIGEGVGGAGVCWSICQPKGAILKDEL